MNKWFAKVCKEFGSYFIENKSLKFFKLLFRMSEDLLLMSSPLLKKMK